LSIPFYFAMEENEADLQAGRRVAQLGFRFHEDGTLRLPERIIPGAAAVIDDNILPLKVPEPAALDRLAEVCENGCFLDFERPINEVGAAIAVGLRQRLSGQMTVPPVFQRLCPDADVQIPGLVYNNWEGFARRVQKQYGDHWALEVIPWDKQIEMPDMEEQNGCLQTAVCHYCMKGRSVHYYDTEETIRKKLAVAERCGCQAGIILLREFKQTHRFDNID